MHDIAQSINDFIDSHKVEGNEQLILPLDKTIELLDLKSVLIVSLEGDDEVIKKVNDIILSVDEKIAINFAKGEMPEEQDGKLISNLKITFCDAKLPKKIMFLSGLVLLVKKDVVSVLRNFSLPSATIFSY